MATTDNIGHTPCRTSTPPFGYSVLPSTDARTKDRRRGSREGVRGLQPLSERFLSTHSPLPPLPPLLPLFWRRPLPLSIVPSAHLLFLSALLSLPFYPTSSLLRVPSSQRQRHRRTLFPSTPVSFVIRFFISVTIASVRVDSLGHLLPREPHCTYFTNL